MHSCIEKPSRQTSSAVTARQQAKDRHNGAAREKKVKKRVWPRLRAARTSYLRYVLCDLIKLMRPLVEASCAVASPSASSSAWMTLASCLPSSTLWG